MDTYTLMCSKLEELQREWEPKEGDRYHYWMSKESEGTGFLDRKDIEDTDNPGMLAYDLDWLPTLDQLVEMMPKDFSYTLEYSGVAEEWIVRVGQNGFVTEHDEIKIALLQALAWSKWGKEWDSEKGEWK